MQKPYEDCDYILPLGAAKILKKNVLVMNQLFLFYTYITFGRELTMT